MFSQVCVSHSAPQCHGAGRPPFPQRAVPSPQKADPLRRQTPHPRYGRRVGGTYPTGMHTCSYGLYLEQTLLV